MKLIFQKQKTIKLFWGYACMYVDSRKKIKRIFTLLSLALWLVLKGCVTKILDLLGLHWTQTKKPTSMLLFHKLGYEYMNFSHFAKFSKLHKLLIVLFKNLQSSFVKKEKRHYSLIREITRAQMNFLNVRRGLEVEWSIKISKLKSLTPMKFLPHRNKLLQMWVS